MSAATRHLVAEVLDPVTLCCDRPVDDVTATGDRIELARGRDDGSGGWCPGTVDLFGGEL